MSAVGLETHCLQQQRQAHGGIHVVVNHQNAVRRVAGSTLRCSSMFRLLGSARRQCRKLNALALNGDMAAHDPADVQQIVDHLAEVPDLMIDERDHRALCLDRCRFRLQQGEGMAHGRQGIAQFVAQRRQKLVHASPGLLQSAHVPQARQVMRDVRVAPQSALRVAHRGDECAGVEGRAILAHPQPLALDPTLIARRLQLLPGLATLNLLGQEKAREVLADDSRCRIAEDVLCPSVPAHDVTTRIEHVDCILLHALDQQAKALLALAQRLFLMAPLGQVAGYLAETNEAGMRIAQRRDDDIRPVAAAILAHAPVLVLEAPLDRRHTQLVFRPAALHGLGWEEAREMRADDLFGAVALDLLCALAPADDDAVGIEHDDGVVAHIGEQRPQPLLVLRQLLFLAAPVRKIPEGAAIAAQCALRIAQGGDHRMRPEALAALPMRQPSSSARPSRSASASS